MSQDENASESEGGQEEGNILERGIDTDERAGRSQGIDPQAVPDEETKEEFEEERQRRLDPENRPDNVEVDNTQRDFDVDRGMFTDRDEYAEDAPKPYADPEDPSSEASEKTEQGGEPQGGSEESAAGDGKRDEQSGGAQSHDEGEPVASGDDDSDEHDEDHKAS